MNYETDTLPNGMRIIHAVNDSPISYCGVLINSGTRDELDNESGLAHFTEHMLYKGTQKRRPHHIINRMEDVGGELNAFTSKEETGVYTVFFEEYLERSIELLADMIFNSQFSEKQLERERIVILDEINSYLDTPSALIYDDFEQVVYNNHDLGNPILGTPESLMQITSATMRDYVQRQFRPDNMVFFSLGSSPFAKVVKKVKKHFGVYATSAISASSASMAPTTLASISDTALQTTLDAASQCASQTASDTTSQTTSQTVQPKPRIAPPETEAKNIAVDKDTHQSHYIMGRKTISMFHPDRVPLFLLNSILGGLGMNSRLNTSLREKNGLVYTVESTHSLYSDSGLFSVYFGCDPANTKRCLNLIQKEFVKLKNTPLTPQQLSKAKKQLKGELGIASENKENMALDMAKCFLHFDRYISLADIAEQIEGVTAEQIQGLANKLLKVDDFSSLHYCG